jgi:flagellar protein FliO/FliZ
MLELTLRLLFSLAVVIGLLLLLARFSSRRLRGQADSLVRVVHRQPISRNNAVCVVAVGSRILVLGTTEHEVRVLAELDPDELDHTATITAMPAPRPARGAHRADVPAVAPAPAPVAAREDAGPLAGSVLSPATWRQALVAATRRVS